MRNNLKKSKWKEMQAGIGGAKSAKRDGVGNLRKYNKLIEGRGVRAEHSGSISSEMHGFFLLLLLRKEDTPPIPTNVLLMPLYRSPDEDKRILLRICSQNCIGKGKSYNPRAFISSRRREQISNTRVMQVIYTHRFFSSNYTRVDIDI